MTRDPVTARKALLAHPLIGQDELAGALLEAPARRGAASRSRGRRVSNADRPRRRRRQLEDRPRARARGRGAARARPRPAVLAASSRARRRRCALLQSLLDEAVGARRRERRAPPPSVAQILLAGVDFPAEEEQLRAAARGAAAAPVTSSSETTRSRCSAPEPSAGGASRSSAARASTASASGPTGRRSGSPRSGRSPATGEAATTSVSRRCSPPRAARTDAAPRTSLEQAVPAHFGLDSPLGSPRRSTPGGSRTDGWSSSRRSCSPRPPHDAAAAAIVERLAAEVVALARVALDAARARAGSVSRSCSAAGCCAPATSGSRRRSPPGSRRWATAIAVHTTDAPPVVGAALLGLDWLGADDGREGASPARARRRRGRRRRPRAGAARRRGGAAWLTIRFERATRIYPGTDVPAVDALDLHVADGELMVLVGPSGSGKSTALRMLAGLEEVDDGGDLDRRPRRHVRAAARPRRRDGLPELRALPVPDGRAEHRASRSRWRASSETSATAASARSRSSSG